MNELQVKKLELAKLRRALKSRLRLAFDGLNPESKPTASQLEILKDAVTKIFWIISGNRSGKSQTGARVVSWWFNDDHPYMERPKAWGTGAIQILVVGRLGEQIESELWERKIKPFLKEGEYKPVKIGNVLQRVEHLKTGNRIIFMSHHDASNAREKVQAFTAQVVWLDEMPDHSGIVTELVMRTIASDGRMYATFTPLIKNEDIRKIVESPTQFGKKHQLAMLDNPIYKGREAEIAEQVRASCASDAEFRARMYGEWYYGDTRVFVYDANKHRACLPDTYSKVGWRHLAFVDPSASGLTGLTVWAEDPLNGVWYNVKAKYLNGGAAFELFEVAESEVSEYNVFWRWCDCNPAGFYKEASRRGRPWTPYSDKVDRKLDTINTLNTRIALGRLKLTAASILLEEELVKASWSTSNPDKIVAASSYHLADTARYVADVLPAWEAGSVVVLTEEQLIRKQWKARVAAREAKVATRMQIIGRRSKWSR